MELLLDPARFPSQKGSVTMQDERRRSGNRKWQVLGLAALLLILTGIAFHFSGSGGQNAATGNPGQSIATSGKPPVPVENSGSR
jgi:hypothetical protein